MPSLRAMLMSYIIHTSSFHQVIISSSAVVVLWSTNRPRRLMDARQSIPAIGARICLPSGHVGTIKYVGPVDGTTGLWLGVEWDDISRGKHDGIKDGKRYFECR